MLSAVAYFLRLVSIMNNDGQNVDFVQLSRKYLRNWRELIKTNALAAELMMFLVEKATTRGNTTNAIVCSYKVLEEISGYSRASVARAIKILKDGNWIQAVKIGNAHAYALNEKVVWREANNKRQYAIFSATVVSAASEQEAGFIDDKSKLNRVPMLSPGEFISVGDEDLPPPDQKDMDLDGIAGDAKERVILEKLGQKRLLG